MSRILWKTVRASETKMDLCEFVSHKHVNSFGNNNETKLLTREEVYSLLRDEHASDKNYRRSKKFEINMK